MEYIPIVLLIAAVVGIPMGILLGNQYGTKRGCGRGCATCGNRDICYRKKKNTQQGGAKHGD